MQLIVDTQNIKKVKTINDLLLLSFIESRIVPGYSTIHLNFLATQQQLNITKRSLITACKHLNKYYGIKFGQNQIIINLNNNQQELIKKPRKTTQKRVKAMERKQRRSVKDFDKSIQKATNKIINFLNTLTNTKHSLTVKNCDLVQNALKQGYTERDLLIIISKMYTVWWHSGTYAQYLVLGTLLKPEKIDDYLNRPLTGQHVPRNLRKELPKYGLKLVRGNIVSSNDDNTPTVTEHKQQLTDITHY